MGKFYQHTIPKHFLVSGLACSPCVRFGLFGYCLPVATDNGIVSSLPLHASGCKSGATCAIPHMFCQSSCISGVNSLTDWVFPTFPFIASSAEDQMGQASKASICGVRLEGWDMGVQGGLGTRLPKQPRTHHTKTDHCNGTSTLHFCDWIVLHDSLSLPQAGRNHHTIYFPRSGWLRALLGSAAGSDRPVVVLEWPNSGSTQASLDGQDRQSPIASVSERNQLSQAILQFHMGRMLKRMNANCAMRNATQRTQGLRGLISVFGGK